MKRQRLLKLKRPEKHFNHPQISVPPGFRYQGLPAGGWVSSLGRETSGSKRLRRVPDVRTEAFPSTPCCSGASSNRVINDLEVVVGDANSRKKNNLKNNKHTHTQNHALRFSKAVFFLRKPHMLAASHVLPELLGDPTLLSVSSAPAHNPRSPKTPKEENPSPCASLPETSTQEQSFPRKRQCSATRWVALAEHICFIFSHLS